MAAAPSGAGVFQSREQKRLIVKRTAIVLLSAALLTGFAAQASAELKIGVVSIPRLAQESPQAKAAHDALSAEFGPRQKALLSQQDELKKKADQLTKDEPTMTDIQRAAKEREITNGNRDLDMQKSAFEDDLNSRQQEEQEKLQRAVIEEVAAFAKAQGYDLILADGVLYANGALDVTNSILQAMQNRKPDAATPAAAAPASKPASKAPPGIAKP